MSSTTRTLKVSEIQTFPFSSMMPSSLLRRCAALLLAALLCLSTAQAGDAREAELNEALAAASGELTPDERTAIKEALEDYFEARESTLAELLKLVESTSAEEMATRWAGPVDGLRDTLNKTLGDCLASIRAPTLRAFTFRQRIHDAEMAFLKGLRGLGTVAARDTIVRSCKELETKDADLQQKWKELVEQDDRLDELERSAAKEMRELLQKAVVDAVVKRRSMMERLAALPGKLEPFRDVAEEVIKVLPDGAVKTILETAAIVNQLAADGAAIWADTNRAAVARLVAIDGHVRTEQGSIVKLFHTTRDEALSFVEQWGTVTARAAYKAAKSDLEDWVSKGKTSGQKDDAQDFADAALALLGEDMSDNESVMQQLEDEHLGRFLGAVDDDTIEALAEPDFWDQERARIEQVAQKVESSLQAWRDEARNVYIGSTTGLTDLERRVLEEEIESRIDALLSVLDAARQALAEDELTGPLERDDLEGDLG